MRGPDKDRECVAGEGEAVVQLELPVCVAESVRVLDGLADRLAVGGVREGEGLREDVGERDPVREGGGRGLTLALKVKEGDVRDCEADATERVFEGEGGVPVSLGLPADAALGLGGGCVPHSPTRSRHSRSCTRKILRAMATLTAKTSSDSRAPTQIPSPAPDQPVYSAHRPTRSPTAATQPPTAVGRTPSVIGCL